MDLTTAQRLKLQAFAKDKELMEAVKLVFNEIRMQTKPNLALSNENIGAIFRAREEAKSLVDAGFSLLSQFTAHTTLTKLNPAR